MTNMEMPASKLVLNYLHCSKTKTFFYCRFHFNFNWNCDGDLSGLIEILMETLKLKQLNL